MKITFDWLQDHLKTNLKEKHLLEQLTNINDIRINKNFITLL